MSDQAKRLVGAIAISAGLAGMLTVAQPTAVLAGAIAPEATITIDKMLWNQFDDLEFDVSRFEFTVTPVSFDPDDIGDGAAIADADVQRLGEPTLQGSDTSLIPYYYGGSEIDDSFNGTVPTPGDSPTAYLIEELPSSFGKLVDIECGLHDDDAVTEPIYVVESFDDEIPVGIILQANAGEEWNCLVVNVPVLPDLALAKSVNNPAPSAGSTVDYTLTVTNVGGDIQWWIDYLAESGGSAAEAPPDYFGAYTIEDTLPFGLTWSAVPEGCTGAGTPTLLCEFTTDSIMAQGSTRVVVATAAIAADAPSGVAANRATVSMAPVDLPCSNVNVEGISAPSIDAEAPCEPVECGAPESRDDIPAPYGLIFPLTANNVACVDITIDRAAAITLTKTDNVATEVHPGDTFAYTLQVGNSGPSSIYGGARVTDDLPDGVSLVSVEGGSGWTCNAADPVVCDYAPSIAPGGGATPVVVGVALATSYVPNSVVNTADVVGTYDFQGGLLTAQAEAAGVAETTVAAASETTVVAHTSNLGVTKTASVSSVPAGGSVVWTITAAMPGRTLRWG